MTDDMIMTEVDLSGFQVVNSQYFSSLTAPSMTIWPDSISFSGATFATLNNYDAISILLSANEKKILITATSSHDPNAIEWRKNSSTQKYCKLSCATFARKLFERWKLDEKCRYRTLGRLVRANKKIMILFDFSQCEIWREGKAVK
ncbi:MAG: hypothetical protein NC033_00575 [Clostridiales bacterium]|nr:hypothetical protein [Clostridiales bacterium]